MTQTLTHNKAESASDLSYKPFQRRNISSRALSFIAALFAAIAVLPLILVLGYVLVQGGSKISLALLTQLPPPPGLEDGGIANAIVGTLVVTAIAALIAVPVGVGGGVFLAEYSRSGWFAQFIRFGTNVLAGVPSIIAGVFIYGTIVTSRILFGNAYSAVSGGMALAVLMLPTVIKTTDEGLKLVPDDLRRGALGVGASRFVTVVRITLPAALTPIATGVVLGIARAAVGDGLEATGVVNAGVGGAFRAVEALIVGETAAKDNATKTGVGVADIFRTDVAIVTLSVLFTAIRKDQCEAL